MLDTKGSDMWIMRHTLGSNKHKTILVNGYYSNFILNAGIILKYLLIYQLWLLNMPEKAHTRTNVCAHTHIPAAIATLVLHTR